MLFSRALAGCGVAVLLGCSAAAAAGDASLIEAARQRDVAAVRRLIKEGADVKARQGDGATALHWAAHWGDLGTADALIGARADVNAVNEYGVSPLSVACEAQQAAVVARLLKAGASPNVAQTNGETPLMTCAATGAFESVKALLARGANVNAVEAWGGQSALMWAVTERHPDVVRVLLEAGADVRARTKVTRMFVNTGPRQAGPATTDADFGGSSPLLFAARSGDVESARLLLAAGADSNDAAADGHTALVVAAQSGHGRLAAFLLANGADPNVARGGFAAIHAAVLRADADLIKALLAHGADPNARITKPNPIPRYSQQFLLTNQVVSATPFLLAAKYAEANLLQLLAAGGADPSATLRNGMTPLMLAAGSQWIPQEDRRERALAIDVLIAAHQDEAPTLAAVNVLLGMGADVNAADATGQTALHAAATQGMPSVVKLLVEHGAKVDVKSTKGITPADAAAAAQAPAVAELLKSLAAGRRGTP